MRICWRFPVSEPKRWKNIECFNGILRPNIFRSKTGLMTRSKGCPRASAEAKLFHGAHCGAASEMRGFFPFDNLTVRMTASLLRYTNLELSHAWLAHKR